MPQTKKKSNFQSENLVFVLRLKPFHSDLNDDCPHHSDHENKDDFANDDNDDYY